MILKNADCQNIIVETEAVVGSRAFIGGINDAEIGS